jgi:DNA-directed RNA polymerase subunit RPC12/RpoP
MSQQNTNINCPRCGGTLSTNGGSDYVCLQCQDQIHAKIVNNAETLEYLADSDLPIAEIAELLLRGK